MYKRSLAVYFGVSILIFLPRFSFIQMKINNNLTDALTRQTVTPAISCVFLKIILPEYFNIRTLYSSINKSVRKTVRFAARAPVEIRLWGGSGGEVILKRWLFFFSYTITLNFRLYFRKSKIQHSSPPLPLGAPIYAFSVCRTVDDVPTRRARDGSIRNNIPSLLYSIIKIRIFYPLYSEKMIIMRVNWSALCCTTVALSIFTVAVIVGARPVGPPGPGCRPAGIADRADSKGPAPPPGRSHSCVDQTLSSRNVLTVFSDVEFSVSAYPSPLTFLHTLWRNHFFFLYNS